MLHQILDAIDEAFTSPRPTRFVRQPDHCDECMEHEATLARLTPETIGLAELGNPAWDPLCFVTDEAFGYLMPALSRLALGTGDQYYLGQFLFHLEYGRAESFSPAQRRVVLRFLEYLYADLMTFEIDSHDDDESLGRVCEKLAAQDNHD